LSKKQWNQPEASWKPLRTFRCRLDPVSIPLTVPDTDHRMASVIAGRQRKLFDDQILACERFLYARVGSESAPFEKLKPAVARYLEITDWDNGSVVAHDGTKYFEVHVQRCEAAILSVLLANSATGSNSKESEPQQPHPDWSPLRIILPLWMNWQSRIRQELLRRLKTALDNHVSRDEIAIFARPGVSAPFKRLPTDSWPILKIVDWQKAVAVTPDGTYWFSIHIQILVDAAPASPPASVTPPAPEPIETDDSEKPVKSAQRESIPLAVNALWGDTGPVGITTQQRDGKIQAWQREKHLTVASPRTIARYFKEKAKLKSP
jgi:hypothetical protein